MDDVPRDRRRRKPLFDINRETANQWRGRVMFGMRLDKTFCVASRMYALLVEMWNPDTGDAWPSQEYIAREIGASERQVRRAGQQMQAAGKVRIHWRRTSGHSGHSYELLVRQIVAADPGLGHGKRPRKSRDVTLRHLPIPDTYVRHDRTHMSGATGQICPPNLP